MKNINHIITKYYNWLNLMIQRKDIQLYHKLLIYNSLMVFDKCIPYDSNSFAFFMKNAKELLDNMSFDDLKQLPKFHLCLYVFLNNDKSKTSIFIKDWIVYLKTSKIERRYDFPFYFWQDYNNELSTAKEKLDYSNLKEIVEIYSSAINITTCFGSENKSFQLDEISYHLLEAIMLLFYKQEYNLILGNMLLRSLSYISHAPLPTIESTLNYLFLQQNANGYFGNYLKNEFDEKELYTILNISFDCIQTLLEIKDVNFRLIHDIQVKLEI